MKPDLWKTATQCAVVGVAMMFARPVVAQDYPALYRDMNLPEYPGAVLDGAGRSSNNLASGLSVTLSTRASNADLRAFYEREMADRGWRLQETITVKKMREAGTLDRLPFRGVFCNGGGVAYNVAAADRGDSRLVNISVALGVKACEPQQSRSPSCPL